MSGTMIAARAPFERIAEHLAERARTLAAARLRMRDDEHRWRRADLLWPLFAKG
ncbi:hypothetical protein SAMN05518801_101109 [Novosphingobium sp. CF614]|uniref:hypothetical protein n=1 Tax=Novosphingobium sp. CF614 TaxID=1884364 RepID=UPI0008E09D1F|nr:hypothetical protein [Novosphingobium sp. CF614]SFF73924.1 hypothetical protein SAMN05518801_101109 [Novosphingobium sp. CF614]